MKFSSKYQPSSKGKAHHNYNRAQSPKTRFAAKINWLRLQTLGAQANLSSAGLAITTDPLFLKLRPEIQQRIVSMTNEARNMAVLLKDIANEIKDLNGPDKWNDAP